MHVMRRSRDKNEQFMTNPSEIIPDVAAGRRPPWRTNSIMLPVDQKKDHCAERRPPFECTALLLQGGGALGAYQAGVYEALSEAGIHPDWVAGISIGAVNSAIIAGNPPEKRVEGLRRFWERITSDVFGSWTQDFLLGPIADRKVYNMVHLIYRAKNYEGNSKDYEFSRSSMETHWRAGYHDTVRTLRHPDVLKRPANHEGVAVFDLEQDGCD
jgi:predicted acylesterase/phospholipase RssA